jgi:ABC-type Fe3+/spermidine/putrescine transport system ATPase subunit
MSQPLLLNLRDLACGYQGQSVVQNLNLHLNAGDIGCLLGSSGCGKTTTLRAIAGFEPVHKVKSAWRRNDLQRRLHPGAGEASHRHGVSGLRTVSLI